MITAAEVLQDSILEANIEANRIRPAIIKSQDIHIKSILGSALFDALYAKRTVQGTWTGLTSYEQTLVDEYLTDCLREYAVFEYIKTGALSIDNAGIVKNFSDNSSVVGSRELKDLEESVEATADYYGQRLQSYLCENSNYFPEYTASNQNPYPRSNNRIKHIYTGKSGKSNRYC